MKTITTLTRATLVVSILLCSQNLFGQWATSGATIYNTNSGFVGIGTGSTGITDKLTIKDGQIRLYNGGQAFLYFYGSNYVDRGYVGWYDNDNSLRLWNKNNSNLIFATNNLPRIWINADGHVGVGTSTPGSYKLAVEGKIGAREVVVTTAAWADYVFENTYNLRPLLQVESFIKENKHLPEVPSAKEVETNGVNLGEMDALLLKKIEELTLYVIEIKKENESLKEEVKKLMLK